MPIIYCEIQPFAAEQSIYTANDNGEMTLAGKTPLDYLDKVLPEICYAKNMYDVKLKCNVRPIALEIADNIRLEETKQYNMNQINVEVE